jgi:hypothetical protein
LAFESNDGRSFNVDMGDGGNSIFRRMPRGTMDLSTRQRHQISISPGDATPTLESATCNKHGTNSLHRIDDAGRAQFRKPVMGDAHIGQAY